YPDDDGALFAATEAAPSTAEEHPGEAEESLGGQVVRLREWAGETDTGDRDDLVPGVSERAWRQVSITSLECLGQRCPLLAECFPERARSRAREADLVVTNHAMLGIAASGNPKVLPEHEILVVDEAHELPDRVTAQATVELSAAVVERTARTARRHAGLPLTGLQEAGEELRPLLMAVPEGRLRSGLPEELAPVVRAIADGAREGMSAMRGQQTSAAEAGEVGGAQCAAGLVRGGRPAALGPDRRACRRALVRAGSATGGGVPVDARPAERGRADRRRAARRPVRGAHLRHARPGRHLPVHRAVARSGRRRLPQRAGLLTVRLRPAGHPVRRLLAGSPRPGRHRREDARGD